VIETERDTCADVIYGMKIYILQHKTQTLLDAKEVDPEGT
jgi:hypothetical protein